jgi:hypothetical protein
MANVTKVSSGKLNAVKKSHVIYRVILYLGEYSIYSGVEVFLSEVVKIVVLCDVM